MKKHYGILAAACLFLFVAGCDEYRLLSGWKGEEQEIAVDGKDSEWRGSMVQIGNLYLGVRNDADYLYLCLTATDTRTKAQLAGLFRQSFSVWFDPAGKKRRTFGLRLSNESPFMDEALVNKVRYIRNPEFQLIVNEMMNNMEIEVMNDNYPLQLLSEVKGIDVAVGTSMNGRKLTYEFRIPLAKSAERTAAIGTAPGSTICVGLETSPIDPDYVVEPLEPGPDGTRRRGYRIVARQHETNGELEPIKYVDLWGSVTLARNGAQPGEN